MPVDFLIRDDDVNFFTDVSELEFAYSKLLTLIPINFAVVPFIIPSVTGCVQSKHWGSEKQYPVDRNVELVLYIKNLIEEYNCNLMMHGITHQYKFRKGLARAEFAHSHHSSEALQESLVYLENIFCTNIIGFVPPSNYVSASAYKKIVRLFPYLFNVPSLKRISRPFTASNIWWWGRRWLSLMTNGMLDHRQRGLGVDLSSIDLGSRTDFNELFNKTKLIHQSEKRVVIVLATHYWEMGGDTFNGSPMHLEFTRFVNSSLSEGINFINLEQLDDGVKNGKYSNIRLF
jgi:hypothetical protein